MEHSLSVIIPTLNEACNLEKTLNSIASDTLEVIVSDGGSQDETLEIAYKWGAKILRGTTGKATQMNTAAFSAQGDILLFLHADTKLPSGYSLAITDILSRKEVVGGAFRLGIDGNGLGFRLIEIGANIRSILFSVPYGDQAIFIKRDLFLKIGGYTDIPIMEDFDLVRRLLKQGLVKTANKSVCTSNRRWTKHGIIKTTAWNWIIVGAWILGVHPARLAAWYKLELNRTSSTNDSKDHG